MRPLEGKTRGMLAADDRVLWAGWVFGMPQMHESRITQYDRPNFFQDTMGRGRFKRYQHDHYFYVMDERTVLNDKIRFTMSAGLCRTACGPVCARALSFEEVAAAARSAQESGPEPQRVDEIPARE